MIFGLVGVLLIFANPATSCIVLGPGPVAHVISLNEGKGLLRQLNSGVARDAVCRLREFGVSNGLTVDRLIKPITCSGPGGEGSGQRRYKYCSMSAPRPQMSFILEETMEDGV